MKLKTSWFEAFFLLLKEFMTEATAKPQYKVVDIIECKKTGVTQAVIQMVQRHNHIKNVVDIVLDDTLIDFFDSKTVRALTYIATVERLKPEYSIVVQQMTDEIAEYILEIKTRNNTTLKKSASEISKDHQFIAKFNAVDAHRIGYMAGIWETVREYQLLTAISQ